jgi:D-sedoheptulose 7-phosphate isomerase
MNHLQHAKKLTRDYLERLSLCLTSEVFDLLPGLFLALREAWEKGKVVYILGNGGSAANAIHIANDFLYGAGKTNGRGLRVEALSANPAVLTCLGNDIGYEYIFAEQLRVKADKDDVLIVLSGSGNSLNVVRAVQMGRELGMNTFAILGYGGGECKGLVQHPIHFPVNDMQIAEDLQLIVGHLCMRFLSENPLTGVAHD